MADRRQPADFAEILTLPEQPLIVGGQAFNIRADVHEKPFGIG
jgi:hypothetical protein